MPDKLQLSPKAERFKQIMSYLNDGLSKDEFLKAFKEVIALIVKSENILIEKNKEMMAKLEDRFKQIIDEIASGVFNDSAIKKIISDFEKLIKELNSAQKSNDENFKKTKKELIDYCISEMGKMVALHKTHMREMEKEKAKMGSSHKEMMTEMGQKMAEMEEKMPDKEEMVSEVKKLIPEPKTPTQIRDDLKTLEGNERLPISAIDDLQEELDKLRKMKGKGFVGGGITGRDLFKDIDLSASLDGVTKTFNIQAVWNIISVHLSSHPYALRKNVDFTYTPTSITFTDQIDASTSLAAGQTAVLTVVTG